MSKLSSFFHHLRVEGSQCIVPKVYGRVAVLKHGLGRRDLVLSLFCGVKNCDAWVK